MKDAVIFVILALCPYVQCQAPANVALQQQVVDADLGRSLKAKQLEYQSLPQLERERVDEQIKVVADSDPDFRNMMSKRGLKPRDIFHLNPDQLTSNEKKKGNESVFRVIDDRITPVIIGNLGAKKSGVEPEPDPILEKSVDDNINLLKNVADSVGRVLYTDKKSFDDNKPFWLLAGTAFVTDKGVMVTACHVLDNLIPLNGEAVLDPKIVAVIDFGSGASSSASPATIHKITEIAGVGDIQELDVAFLRVEGIDAIQPLSFSRNPVQSGPVFVIGYPEFSAMTSECENPVTIDSKYFCKFRLANPDVYKIASPGLAQNEVEESHFKVFQYNSPTRFGQSGAPVLNSADLQVVGLHYCCTGTTTQITRLNCATSHIPNPTFNEAISVSTFRSDPVLSKFITFTKSNTTDASIATRFSSSVSGRR